MEGRVGREGKRGKGWTGREVEGEGMGKKGNGGKGWREGVGREEG